MARPGHGKSFRGKKQKQKTSNDFEKRMVFHLFLKDFGGLKARKPLKTNENHHFFKIIGFFFSSETFPLGQDPANWSRKSGKQRVKNPFAGFSSKELLCETR